MQQTHTTIQLEPSAELNPLHSASRFHLISTNKYLKSTLYVCSRLLPHHSYEVSSKSDLTDTEGTTKGRWMMTAHSVNTSALLTF